MVLPDANRNNVIKKRTWAERAVVDQNSIKQHRQRSEKSVSTFSLIWSTSSTPRSVFGRRDTVVLVHGSRVLKYSSPSFHPFLSLSLSYIYLLVVFWFKTYKHNSNMFIIIFIQIYYMLKANKTLSESSFSI